MARKKDEKQLNDIQSLKLYNRYEDDEYDRFGKVYEIAKARSKGLASQSDLMRELIGFKDHGLTTLEDRLYLLGEGVDPSWAHLMELHRVYLASDDGSREQIVKQLQIVLKHSTPVVARQDEIKELKNGTK